MKKQEVLNFIKSNEHAVISTCRDNKPEAALIGFGETDDFELIFGTHSSSRKYQNLKENIMVAFVIGWKEDSITVQYEGRAVEIFGEELERYVNKYHQKVPSAVVHKNHPDQTYFKVQPTWMRYSDLSGKEERVFEFHFK